MGKVLETRDVMMTHGPPGTNRTTTLAEAIYKAPKHESQVLVYAQSSMAIDWINERLVGRSVNILRIGNPMRVNGEILLSTCKRRFESHPDYP